MKWSMSAFGGKKFLILILGLSLIAASCDLSSIFGLGGGGVRGVFKSTDNGETYDIADKLQNNKGDISGLTANSITFDSSNPDIIYFASSNGIYKSTDAANSWSFILSGIAVSDIAVDPSQSNIIYAAGIVGSNGKIIKSLDGGTSWVDLYTEPSSDDTVLSIAVSSSNSQVILAGLTTGEIIRSADGGHSWQATENLSDRVLRIQFGPSGAYVLSSHKGLQKSSDGGLTWKSISSVLVSDNLTNPAGPPTQATAFYDMALDSRQGGVVYLGTEQGIFRTANDGNSWSFIALPVKNASLRVTAIAINPNNSSNIFAGVASTLFKSLDGGLTWEIKVLPTGASISKILINPQSNNLIYLGMGP